MSLLPPGMTEGTFARALDEFRAAIGAEWVFTSEADRASYLDPFDIGDQDAHASAAALAIARVRADGTVVTIPAKQTSSVFRDAGGVLWGGSLVYAGFFFGNIPWIKGNLTLIIVGIIVVSLVPVGLAWLQSRKGS